jgi:ankyrin repeat protein
VTVHRTRRFGERPERRSFSRRRRQRLKGPDKPAAGSRAKRKSGGGEFFFTGDGGRGSQALYAGEQDRALFLLPADDERTVFEAAAFGRTDRLRSLLSTDSTQANAVSGDGFTPLHLAVFGKQEEALRILIARGRISMRSRLRRLLSLRRWERLHSSGRRTWRSYCLKRALIPQPGARRHSRPQRQWRWRSHLPAALKRRVDVKTRVLVIRVCSPGPRS